jgi:tRNA-dihydrouridine synthase B
MVGRGAVGRPWVLRRIAAAIDNAPIDADPSLEERRRVILRQYEESLELYGIALGVKVVRKHLAAYANDLPEGEAFRATACRSSDPSEVRRLIEQHFGEDAERRAA